MKGTDHYVAAEKLLDEATVCAIPHGEEDCGECAFTLARAQVHATLALFHATAAVVGEVHDLAVIRETQKAV